LTFGVVDGDLRSAEVGALLKVLEGELLFCGLGLDF
jgi:hypothetical protein